MLASTTAERKNIKNDPGKQELINIAVLCAAILQPARDIVKKPLIVTSGFRCKELNQVVGGVSNSFHLRGMAADIRCTTPIDAIAFSNALTKQPYCDLVLWENHQWIHVQWDYKPRHLVNLDYNTHKKINNT